MNNPNWYTKLSQEVRQRIMFPGTDRNPAGPSGSTPSTTTSVGQIYLSSDSQVPYLPKYYAISKYRIKPKTVALVAQVITTERFTN